MLCKFAIEFGATYWNNEYGKYFEDISIISLDESIRRYCDIDMLDPKSVLNVGMFIYYLIKNEKFDNISINFIVCYPIVVSKILAQLQIQKVKNFEKTLLQTNRANITIDDVDLMNGAEFEQFVAQLFSKMGYQTEVTKHSGDQGIDVIAEKNGKTIGIQAKCYSNSVTNSAIQEVVAGISHYHLDKAIVITNNYFTNSAQELANSNNVILWDRNMLKEKINQLMI